MLSAIKNLMLQNLLLCSCPLGEELVDVAHEPCKENFGQLGAIIVQRSGATPITLGDATLYATWSVLLSAVTPVDKIQITPRLSNTTQEGGDARTTRGGAASFGGTPIVIGSNPTTFMGEILSTSQATIASLKQLSCEKNLKCWLVNTKGQIAGVSDDTHLLPFSIADDTLFFSDKTIGGYEDVDNNKMQFSFLEDWSDNFKVVALSDGNALNLIEA